MENNRYSYVEKDAITINEKLVIEKSDNAYITRIPYTREYVKFPKDATEWISDVTMKVHIPDDMQILHSMAPEFDSHTQINGKQLKTHYDEVIRKYAHQNQEQTSINNHSPTVPEQNKKEQAPVKEMVQEVQITPEIEDRVYREVEQLDSFSQRVYADDNIIKYYPHMMRGDEDLNKILTYRNQQNIFANDYAKRNEPDKKMECQQNIKVANAMINEKTEAAVQKIKLTYQTEMQAMQDCSPVALDIEQFKKFPADLQKEESFKQMVLYKAQLEDLRTSYINAINTNTDNYKAALGAAAPDVLLKYESSIQTNEKTYLDNIASLTDKINNVNFAINYEVSKMQRIQPAIIPDIGDQMRNMNIKTLGQVERIMHSQDNLMKLGNSMGNLNIYQTKDGRNFVGRNLNGRVEQIGAHNSLKEIRKSFKNYIKECKQEMKLQPKIQMALGR